MTPTERHSADILSTQKRVSRFTLRDLLRGASFALPAIALGPLLLFAVLYWWFVPDGMRIGATYASPSIAIKVCASILVLPSLLLSTLVAEGVASALPSRLVNSLHRVVAPIPFVFKLVGYLLFFWLFAPLVDIPGPSPRTVVLIFCFLAFATSVNVLKSSLAIFAVVDQRARPPEELAGVSATALMKSDPRPPIVYLRSFAGERMKATMPERFAYLLHGSGGFYFVARRPRASDRLWTLMRKAIASDFKRMLLKSRRSAHDEQMLFAEYFSDYGPYVAIGRPGESREAMDLGAAKDASIDEEWKRMAIDLIEKSAAIVIEAGDSAGLLWEIEEVIKRVRPEKVLMILPRESKDYREFSAVATRLFPRPMPVDPPVSRLIIFESDWSPVAIDIDSIVLGDALAPFARRIFGSETESNETGSVQ